MVSAGQVMAVTIRVPDTGCEDDVYCLAECADACARLEQYLEARRYEIPDWVRGGCEEDWGVHFTCRDGDRRYVFSIGFFPDDVDVASIGISVQYHIRKSSLFGLLSRLEEVPATDRLHRSMREFAESQPGGRVYTEEEFNAFL